MLMDGGRPILHEDCLNFFPCPVLPPVVYVITICVNILPYTQKFDLNPFYGIENISSQHCEALWRSDIHLLTSSAVVAGPDFNVQLTLIKPLQASQINLAETSFYNGQKFSFL